MTLTRCKDRIIKEQFIEPRITIRELRHSHATLLLDKGAELEAVSKRLGHSSIKITESIYAHHLPRKNAYLLRKWDTIYTE